MRVSAPCQREMWPGMGIGSLSDSQFHICDRRRPRALTCGVHSNHSLRALHFMTNSNVYDMINRIHITVPSMAIKSVLFKVLTGLNLSKGMKSEQKCITTRRGQWMYSPGHRGRRIYIRNSDNE